MTSTVPVDLYDRLAQLALHHDVSLAEIVRMQLIAVQNALDIAPFLEKLQQERDEAVACAQKLIAENLRREEEEKENKRLVKLFRDGLKEEMQRLVVH